MNYVSNEVVASAIREKAYEAIAKNKDMSDLARTLAKGAADVVYKKKPLRVTASGQMHGYSN